MKTGNNCRFRPSVSPADEGVCLQEGWRQEGSGGSSAGQRGQLGQPQLCRAVREGRCGVQGCQRGRQHGERGQGGFAVSQADDRDVGRDGRRGG